MLLQVFINTELYARVSVSVLFQELWKQVKEKSRPEAEEARQSGKLFLLKLLDSAVPFSDLEKLIHLRAMMSEVFICCVSCQSFWMLLYLKST